MRAVTISIVSHGHGQLVMGLLSQLVLSAKYIERVIVTHNLPGDEDPHSKDFPFDITNIHNKAPLGFGANHNQAFECCSTAYFCVMNPDIHIKHEPFRPLLSCHNEHDFSIIAPLIVNLEGGREDSARFFPTPWGLLKKIFGQYDGVFPISDDKMIEYPDWVAGMFLLIKSEKYAELSGFDESFFLYYEDVDLCIRVWKEGNTLALYKDVAVIHDARCSSHKEFRFFRWHLMSVLRFFWKHWGRFPNKEK